MTTIELKEAVLPLRYGSVVLSYPEKIARDEIDSVMEWVELMQRKLRRAALSEVPE